MFPGYILYESKFHLFHKNNYAKGEKQITKDQMLYDLMHTDYPE